MTPVDALVTIIRPALARLGPQFMGQLAEVQMLNIALQESRLEYRVQLGGPAHGFWQMEKGGGVHGVLNHPATRDLARDAASRLIAATDEYAVYMALSTNDELAAIFARLLLYTDPQPLPGLSDTSGSWNYYQRNWRPGRPRPATWPDYRKAAIAATNGVQS